MNLCYFSKGTIDECDVRTAWYLTSKTPRISQWLVFLRPVNSCLGKHLCYCPEPASLPTSKSLAWSYVGRIEVVPFWWLEWRCVNGQHKLNKLRYYIFWQPKLPTMTGKDKFFNVQYHDAICHGANVISVYLSLIIKFTSDQPIYLRGYDNHCPRARPAHVGEAAAAWGAESKFWKRSKSDDVVKNWNFASARSPNSPLASFKNKIKRLWRKKMSHDIYTATALTQLSSSDDEWCIRSRDGVQNEISTTSTSLIPWQCFGQTCPALL